VNNIDTEKVWRNFVDTITNHYTDFTGRIGRAQFWYFVLVYVAVGFAVSIVGQIVASGGALSSLYNLALFLPSLGMTMRRLQDTGRPGSWAWLLAVPVGAGILLRLFALVTFLTLGLGAVLLLLAPLFGLASLFAIALLIYFCAQPGQAGSNEYGPMPAPWPPSSPPPAATA
jgi:uncharacterized membrane protein YhaH (DUF805 family)